jgi:hypothetical protein
VCSPTIFGTEYSGIQILSEAWMSSAGREPTLPTGAPFSLNERFIKKCSPYKSGVLELDQRPWICEIAAGSKIIPDHLDVVNAPQIGRFEQFLQFVA